MIYFDENKKPYGFLENPYATCTQELWDDIMPNGRLGVEWDVIGGEFIDLRQSTNYLNQQRLKEIERELNALDKEYTINLDTPVAYPVNGFSYKPKYAQETYLSLLTAGQMIPSMFPMKIWDSTELEANAVDMSLADLTALTMFLANIQQGYFNERKEAKALLQQEKERLNV